jgi:hypothetical protein
LPGQIIKARQPWRRLAAWAIDCIVILGWVGVVAAVGVPLYLAGVTHSIGLVELNIVAAIVVIAPVTLSLALLEHRLGATVGKRLLRLDVEHDGRRPSLGRACSRNAVKIAAPWVIGHAAVFAVATDPTPLASLLLVGAYVLPVIWVASLWVKDGRTPYDRASRTVVRRR